jgi:hypothetical protein
VGGRTSPFGCHQEGAERGAAKPASRVRPTKIVHYRRGGRGGPARGGSTARAAQSLRSARSGSMRAARDAGM